MQNKEFIDIFLEQTDDWSIRIMKVFFILFFIIGIYISYDMWYVYNQASKDTLSIYKPDVITDDSLKAISEDCVAWLEITDTSIDYPVMQGEDNVEYLNKAPDGSFAVSGSIFLDSRNNPDFSDHYNIIYGHHMANGYMFGALDKFKEEDYFRSHRTGILNAGNHEYKLYVIGFLFTDANDNEIFDTDFKDEEKRYEKIKSKAVWWDDRGDGNIVALTTCKEPLTTRRTALICRIE